MPDTDDLIERLANSAEEPLSATVDGQSATRESVSDQIKRIEYTRTPISAKSLLGNRTRLIPAPKE